MTDIYPRVPERMRFGSGRWLAWVWCAWPLLWLVLFAAFVLRAQLTLGYWPLPHQPDPKALGFTLHYWALMITLPMNFAVGFSSPVFLLHRQGWRWTLLAFASFAIFLMLMWLNPGSTSTWFAD